jgi:hypothetical protein
MSEILKDVLLNKAKKHTENAKQYCSELSKLSVDPEIIKQCSDMLGAVYDLLKKL